ncbi:MAG: hypothetical protein HY044_01510 [Candidatus Woesebacteria bacterium]|nr:MAG: hypothetical protein HY044_01510 [Candidatus Woesebacteria bacterium]
MITGISKGAANEIKRKCNQIAHEKIIIVMSFSCIYYGVIFGEAYLGYWPLMNHSSLGQLIFWSIITILSLLPISWMFLRGNTKPYQWVER